jgi:hypothetical protein
VHRPIAKTASVAHGVRIRPAAFECCRRGRRGGSRFENAGYRRVEVVA